MPDTKRTKTASQSEKGKNATQSSGKKGGPRGTKKEQLVRMLSAKSGADIPTISQKMGWQPHTTRAALSGLRKAGHELIRAPGTNGRPARYRIGASLRPTMTGTDVAAAPAHAG